jgi:hypothetical protein
MRYNSLDTCNAIKIYLSFTSLSLSCFENYVLWLGLSGRYWMSALWSENTKTGIKVVKLVQTTIMYIVLLHFDAIWTKRTRESLYFAIKAILFTVCPNCFHYLDLRWWSILHVVKTIKLQVKWHIRWNDNIDYFTLFWANYHLFSCCMQAWYLFCKKDTVSRSEVWYFDVARKSCGKRLFTMWWQRPTTFGPNRVKTNEYHLECRWLNALRNISMDLIIASLAIHLCFRFSFVLSSR